MQQESPIPPPPASEQATTAATAETTAAPQRVAGELASRSDRFWAAIIDGVLQVLLCIPLFWWLGKEGLQNQTPAIALLVALYGLAAYLVLHGYLLHKYGQTIGKAEFGMRIERTDGQVPGLQHIVLWRYLPVLLLSYVPLIGQLLAGLLNPLLIFRADRRCLHDHIAGTVVKYCYQEPAAAPVGAPSDEPVHPSSTQLAPADAAVAVQPAAEQLRQP